MENQEKKNFFELLEPRSAMLIGGLAAILTLCTIGFIVLGIISLTKGVNCSAKNSAATVKTNVTATQTGNQLVKSDKPTAELFVMSYCPYGLQMEKAYLPVMELLSKKADMSIRFVYYAMHGKKETDENTRQFCIQKEQNDKLLAYMKCFTGKDDSAACLQTAGINQTKLNACVNATDKQYGITEKYNDKSTWLSGAYPLYPVDQDLNEKYGVGGSPTLIVNGVEMDVSRNAEAVKTAICAAFNNPPEECNTTLSAQSYTAGFGYDAGTATDASCS